MRSGRKISTKRPIITPRTGSAVDGPFAESTVCIVYRWAVVPSLTQRNMVVEAAGGVEPKTRFETRRLLISAAHCSQPCHRSHLCWISLDQRQRIDIAGLHPRNGSRGIVDMNYRLLAQHAKGSFDLARLGLVFRAEHSPDNQLCHPQATCEFGVVYAGPLHSAKQSQLWGKIHRHRNPPLTGTLL